MVPLKQGIEGEFQGGQRRRFGMSLWHGEMSIRRVLNLS